jgi:hypothetical protein
LRQPREAHPMRSFCARPDRELIRNREHDLLPAGFVLGADVLLCSL